MPSKTVEFLNIRLSNKKTGEILNTVELKQIFQEIFDAKCIKTGECETLDLTPKVSPDSYDPKILLDIYDSDNTNFMFARVSRKKENNAIQRRDYDTYIAEDVFTSDEIRKLGIEVFTYFIIDYEKGIMSIVNAKDAPGAKILNYIFDEYNTNYEIEFINIPNKDGIMALYNSHTPVISGYEFEIPVPNAEYLQDFLGLTEEEIVEIVNDKVHKATLILRPEPYKNLESNPNKIKKIIDIIKGKKYQHSIIRAKTDEFNTRNYDLHAKYFTYPLTVKKYKTVGGVKKELTNKQMKEQFKEGLFNAYMKNYDLILAITNGENGE